MDVVTVCVPLSLVFLALLFARILFVLSTGKFGEHARKTAEKRWTDFQGFAKNHGFEYQAHADDAFFDDLGDFYLFNKTSSRSLFGSAGNKFATNIVSGSEGNVHWDIFDYTYETSPGKHRNSMHCTAFIAEGDLDFPAKPRDDGEFKDILRQIGGGLSFEAHGRKIVFNTPPGVMDFFETEKIEHIYTKLKELVMMFPTR